METHAHLRSAPGKDLKGLEGLKMSSLKGEKGLRAITEELEWTNDA